MTDSDFPKNALTALNLDDGGHADDVYRLDTHNIPELTGVDIKDEATCWVPGRRIELKREGLPVGCAWIIAVPAAVFVAFVFMIVREQILGGPGSWMSFTISAVVALLIGGWLAFRFARGKLRETIIDWDAQRLSCRAGRRLREYNFQEILQLRVVPVQSQNSNQAEVMVETEGANESILATRASAADAVQACRQLVTVTRRLAESLGVPWSVGFNDEQNDEAFANVGPSDAELARGYEELGNDYRSSHMLAEFKGDRLKEAAMREQAIACFMEATRLNPSRPEPMLEVAKLAGDDSLRDRAIEAAAAASPNDPAPLLERGFRMLLEDRYEDALADFTRAIELEPSSEAYGGRAEMYAHFDRYPEAVADFDKAIELEPDRARFYEHRADCLATWYGETQDEKLLERSLADFDKAIQIAPDDYTTKVACCAALRKAERFDEAIRGLTEVIADHQSETYPLQERARTHFDAGNFKEAVRDLTKAIQLLEKVSSSGNHDYRNMQKSSLGFAYRQRSDAYQALGENIRADEDLARSEELLNKT